MTLQIFTIKKFLRWTLAAISLDSALKKDENYYLQVFLKECKYIDNKVIRHVTQDMEIFSSKLDEE